MRGLRFFCAILLALSLLGASVTLQPQDKALLLHNRIAAVPPDKSTAARMVKLLGQDKKQQAAEIATNSPSFYNITLRNMFSAWSNKLGNVNVDLNDMVATMIGMVRDNVPFNEVLSGDYLYTDENGSYNASENNIYRELQKKDLQQALVKKKQSEVFANIQHLPAKAQAGILSTRAYGLAYFTAGTNRRATAFTLKYFLCHDMEALHNTDLSDKKVRADVSRAPGGDANLFNNRCKGCHSGMDALSGWNVYYDFDRNQKKTVYSEQVNAKINKNQHVYPNGNTPVDDSFENLWAEKEKRANQKQLGWGAKTSGRGAKDFGRMITASDAFASCMATHVYRHVCLFMPDNSKEQALRDTLASEFKGSGYNLRKLFAATAVACLLGED